MTEFVTAYGPKRRAPKSFAKGSSMTKQNFKDASDVNQIVKKFRRTGAIEHLNQWQGSYGEFLNMDYHAAMNEIAAADSMFSTIPAHVREHFKNDPQAFIDYALDESNHAQMQEWGLAHSRLPDGSARPTPPKPAESSLEDSSSEAASAP